MHSPQRHRQPPSCTQTYYGNNTCVFSKNYASISLWWYFLQTSIDSHFPFGDIFSPSILAMLVDICKKCHQISPKTRDLWGLSRLMFLQAPAWEMQGPGLRLASPRVGRDLDLQVLACAGIDWGWWESWRGFLGMHLTQLQMQISTAPHAHHVPPPGWYWVSRKLNLKWKMNQLTN